MSQGDVIGALVRRFVVEAWPEHGEPQNLHRLVVEVVEKPLIEAVLERCNGNQSRAAIALGIDRNTLRKLVRRHGIKGRP